MKHLSHLRSLARTCQRALLCRSPPPRRSASGLKPEQLSPPAEGLYRRLGKTAAHNHHRSEDPPFKVYMPVPTSEQTGAVSDYVRWAPGLSHG